MRAREVLGERERLRRLGLVVLGDDLDLGDALGELQRGLERVGEPALDAGAAHQPVDDDLDRVLLVALELAAWPGRSTTSPSTRARVKP